MAPTSRLAWPVLALALTAVACASTQPAVSVTTGSRVLVRLYEARQDLVLALANESHPDLQDMYSSERMDAALKLAPDELMGELLASLDNAGMDTFGTEEAEPGGSRGYLMVQHGLERRVFPAPDRSASGEARQAWARMKLIMDHYYQHVGSLQYVANPGGRSIFRGDD
ncbi:MAG: hypothetical protein DRQ55_09050 [Planctomycetota bacterium]|nr:MAG: hypothetical protein DRQ55_09050 [Planctomycetota bacterium]